MPDLYMLIGYLTQTFAIVIEDLFTRCIQLQLQRQEDETQAQVSGMTFHSCLGSDRVSSYSPQLMTNSHTFGFRSVSSCRVSFVSIRSQDIACPAGQGLGMPEIERGRFFDFQVCLPWSIRDANTSFNKGNTRYSAYILQMYIFRSDIYYRQYPVSAVGRVTGAPTDDSQTSRPAQQQCATFHLQYEISSLGFIFSVTGYSQIHRVQQPIYQDISCISCSVCWTHVMNYGS